MTESEVIEFEQRCSESKLQHICVSWFRQTFPEIADLLFAVPNGGWRGARSGAIMVYEGQVRGVSDLILLYPSSGLSSLCIEMKIPKRKGRSAGKQSEYQKSWQTLAEANGNKYVVCHGLIEFIEAVCSYMFLTPQIYKNKALDRYPLYLR